ncbi:MAG TPA: DinB family protein [Candidatus Limnocylindrales bacterium]|nr:DinB family protein [Candidatus Limnocylindrales bacterium]
MERLRYDDDTAFTLADDASTIARITRTADAARLRALKFGEWTALEVIGHVADMGEIFAERVRRMVEEERPTLQSADQDAIHAERRNNDRDPMTLSKRIQTAHGQIIGLLATAANRARPGLHGEWGEIDAAHVAAYQARHAHEHVTELAEAFPPSR